MNETKYTEIFIPKSYAGDDPNVFISLNGKNYLLPKGKTSKVPEAVRAEYERSLKAQEALDKRTEALLEKASRPL